MAKPTERIQKRIVTLYGDQPMASKWWCMGANLKILLPPRNFFETSCKITEPDVITSGRATTGRIRTESVRNAKVARVIVSPMTPVSPI